MANINSENRRRKVRQQQKHMNQILGLILGEKNYRELTLRHKRRKEDQSSFVISVAKNSVRKVWDTTGIWLHIMMNHSIQKLTKEEEKT
jgi:hypothetical protein